MLDFEEFYDIAEYGNEAWKGSFTKKEIAQNAYDYLCEFNTSVENGEPTKTIKDLYKLLVEDESEECLSWAYDIAKEIGLIDMDFMDYLDTDIEVIARFLEQDNKDRVIFWNLNRLYYHPNMLTEAKIDVNGYSDFVWVYLRDNSKKLECYSCKIDIPYDNAIYKLQTEDIFSKEEIDLIYNKMIKFKEKENEN